MKRSSPKSSPLARSAANSVSAPPTASTPTSSTELSELSTSLGRDTNAPLGTTESTLEVATANAVAPTEPRSPETLPPGPSNQTPVDAARKSPSKPRVMHFRSQLTTPFSLRPSLSRDSQLPEWAAPFFVGLPALLLGVIVLTNGSQPLPVPAAAPVVIEQRVATKDLLQVPISRTMIVQSEASNGSVVLRGRVQPQAALLSLGNGDDGGSVTNGRAEVNGTVARVWVKPGDYVQAGQMVVQISTGAATRPAPRAEAAQTRAEAAQVAAADQQKALDQRLEDAQTRLLAAQTRVKAAQVKVDQARNIVRRLQQNPPNDTSLPSTSGEIAPNVGTSPTIPTPLTPAVTPTRAPGIVPDESGGSNRDGAAGRGAPQRDNGQRDATQRDAAQRAREALLRDARRYSEDADGTEQRAKAAQEEATKAEGDARTTKAKIPDLQAKVQTLQKAFDAGGAKGSEVEAARAAVEDAQNDVNEASTRAVVSRQEAEQLRTKAQTLRAKAQETSARAAATLRDLQVFSDSPSTSAAATTAPSASKNSSPSAKRRRRKNRRNRTQAAQPVPLPAPVAPHPAPVPPTAPSSDNLPSGMRIQQAAKMVRAAVTESEAALEDAHRIEREVADYKRRVSSTQQSLEDASKGLMEAQNRVLSTGIHTVTTTIHARTAGIVESVASLAQNVGPDDVVITVRPPITSGAPHQRSTPAVLEARIPDPSGVWRTLRPGRTLSALLINSTAQPANTPLTSAPRAGAPGRPKSSAQAANPTSQRPNAQSQTLQQRALQKQALQKSALQKSALQKQSAQKQLLQQRTEQRSRTAEQASGGTQLPPHRVQPGGSLSLQAQDLTRRQKGGVPRAGASAGTTPVNSAAVQVKQGNKAVSSKQSGIAVLLRVRDVAPPARPGAPAIVRAAVNYQAPAGSDTSKLLGAGAGVLCSIPRPGGRRAMHVPVGAIWHDANGVAKVAVLRETPNPTAPSPIEPQPALAPTVAGSPIGAGASSPLVTPSLDGAPQSAPSSALNPSAIGGVNALPSTDSVAVVEWRTVEIGSSDGVLQEVTKGLLSGERIVLDPQLVLLKAVSDPASAPNQGSSSEAGLDAAPSMDGAPERTPDTESSSAQGMQPTRAERVLLVPL